MGFNRLSQCCIRNLRRLGEGTQRSHRADEGAVAAAGAAAAAAGAGAGFEQVSESSHPRAPRYYHHSTSYEVNLLSHEMAFNGFRLLLRWRGAFDSDGISDTRRSLASWVSTRLGREGQIDGGVGAVCLEAAAGDCACSRLQCDSGEAGGRWVEWAQQSTH